MERIINELFNILINNIIQVSKLVGSIEHVESSFTRSLKNV